LIFLLVLFIGGLPVYLTYYRKSKLMQLVRRTLAPLNLILTHGYFFDDFYEKVIAKGLVRVSEGVRHVDSIIGRVPYLFADGVISLARGTHKYLDVLVDELLYAAANRTLGLGSSIEKTHSQPLQRYIMAALLGFLVLSIVVVVTMLRVK
jgi:NADH:ubiquinone oxidoreductase subunit 5 (subunit L)/multisubunit Na+/H+ antiporter MnhA subunit